MVKLSVGKNRSLSTCPFAKNSHNVWQIVCHSPETTLCDHCNITIFNRLIFWRYSIIIYKKWASELARFWRSPQFFIHLSANVFNPGEKFYFGAMHLTPPTTTCSMWLWKIIREHLSSSMNGFLRKLPALIIWHRSVGLRVFAALNAGIKRRGRRSAHFINAESADVRLR